VVLQVALALNLVPRKPHSISVYSACIYVKAPGFAAFQRAVNLRTAYGASVLNGGLGGISIPEEACIDPKEKKNCASRNRSEFRSAASVFQLQ
jgi:hypothetical protein